jgi:predicted O-methyltransferase YrrM
MVFHEPWISEQQVEFISRLIEQTRGIPGCNVEIGCWEGKSTVALANACFPERIIAVDSWAGNLSEGEGHATIALLKQRDVFGTFCRNIQELTKGNVEIVRSDCFDFLEAFKEPIKFCYIDAAHDYDSVRATLEMILPKLVIGGVLCGDDYTSAHVGRADLRGGVQRAAVELLSDHMSAANAWVWVKRR